MITDFRLTVFITVARTLSFTRAASLLNISQPAISKHIKELESDFKEALFNRKGNSISLTDKARSITPLIENILEGYNRLNDTIDRDDFQYEGALQIGASTTIAQYLLPEILAKFNKSYPNIHLSVASANSDAIVKMLQRKEIEMALIEGDSTTNSVHYAPLIDDEIVLVSRSQPKRKLRVDEIEKIPLVIREDGSGTLSVTLSALRDAGISRKMLNIKLQLGSSEAILRYIRSSNEFAFVSIRVAEEYIKRGEIAIHEVEGLSITRQFRYVTLHGQSGRLASCFKEFCNAHYNI